MAPLVSLHMLLLFCTHYRTCKATISADTSDSCCCNGSSLRTSTWTNLQSYISPHHFSGFSLKGCQGSFIYVIQIHPNTTNFMLNSSFQHTEEFTYSNFIETCCPRLRSECGCLRLSCECRLGSLQYYLLPAVSVFIRFVCGQIIYFSNFKCGTS